MMELRVSLVAALLLVACTDAGNPATTPTRARPLVCATIPPLRYFAQRLAGQQVDCEVILPAGADPQHWVPDRTTLQHMASADQVLFHGAGLEGWQGKVGLPRSRCWVVCTGFDERFIKIANAVTHTHGGQSHTHDGVDPFLWLDLQLAARQAGVVARAMQQLVPDHADAVQRNLQTLERDLTAEHAAQTALKLEGMVIGATHRVYSYWARSQAVQLVELDLQDPTLGAERIVTACQALTTRGARLVLTPTELGETSRAAFAAAGITVVVFDPCFHAAPDSDFLAVMAANRTRLAEALGK